VNSFRVFMLTLADVEPRQAVPRGQSKMSVRKSKKQKKQPPQKCSTTETVAVTRPEDEQDYSPEELEEMQKKVAAMFGIDIEADRRLDNEFMARRRRLRDRYQGALVRLVAGDALGTTLEFKTPGTFKPLSDMVGGGPFNLQPGQWTDDTSMALCLGESLVHCHGLPRKNG
jgi:hypothetical protein